MLTAKDSSIEFSAAELKKPTVATAKELIDRASEFLKKDAEEITIAIQTAVDGLAFRALGDLESWPPQKQKAQLEATVNRLINPDAANRPYRE